MTIRFWITRTLAYGAIPALRYLVAMIFLGSGYNGAVTLDRAQLLPVLYIWIVAGALMTGRVARKKREAELR